MTIEELKKLIANRETEHVELKGWKPSIPFEGLEKFENRRCLLGYCVAIGNEGGGYLIVGVSDNGDIIGTSATLAVDAKKKVYDKTSQKIIVEEVRDEDNKRIIVVHIPSRPIGTLLKFAGVPLMRVDDSLEVMSDEEQRRILLEGQDDFSAEVCKGTTIMDVDPDAMQQLRWLHKEKNPGSEVVSNDAQYLSDLQLLQDGMLTYAGVILLAKKEVIVRYLRQAEICFEYRNNRADIPSVERVDYREPFVFVAQKIGEKILSRQQMHQIQEGLFRTDIPAYDEEVFREALFNAVCHRDYRQQGSVFIKQSPEMLEISNPGGFPFGVTADNIITVQPTSRNALLAESFQRIFKGVERAGQGADKIFKNTIEEGKGSPDYSVSDHCHVVLKIPAMLEDRDFIRYLKRVAEERRIDLEATDYVLLDKIRRGEKMKKEQIAHLIEKWLLEAHGKTRGMQYVLSSDLYHYNHTVGTRTHRMGLSREYRKQIILEHLRRNKTGTMAEFMQALPETKRLDITNLLGELKKAGKIKKVSGKTRGAVWGLIT